ncbi:MAG: glycosyltransferase [Anaerolineae bacterium]|nr:glycosyltransferase [Anaerolineae bacterium]
MKVTIVAIGSRGDTQPYLAFARGLQQAGYQVRFCAGDNFRDFVTGYGVDFVPVGVDIQQFINTRIPQVLETGRNTFQAIRTVIRESLAYADVMWAGIQTACGDADVIGTNFLGVGAAAIAEKRRIPIFLLHSTPLIGRTRIAPPMIFPVQRNMGGPVNLLWHELTEFFLKLGLRRPLNQWRDAVGLAPLPFRNWRFDALPDLTIPMLYAHSPAVLPRPSDWLSHWHVTGYWFLDAPDTWQPPAELLDFLKAGAPPVYIGFGSMSGRSPEQMAQLVCDALKQSGRRGVLAAGWGGMSRDKLDEDIYVLDAVPHDWLFPQVDAVVHHGGAGTTAAGFRAGVPSIIVPHFGDQLFWGKRAEKLGVGARPIPRKALTASQLAAAICQATGDVAMQQRAVALGETIRAECGIDNAIRIIEHYLHESLPLNRTS